MGSVLHLSLRMRILRGWNGFFSDKSKISEFYLFLFKKNPWMWGYVGSTIVVSGDGRYWSKDAIQVSSLVWSWIMLAIHRCALEAMQFVLHACAMSDCSGLFVREPCDIDFTEMSVWIEDHILKWTLGMSFRLSSKLQQQMVWRECG